MQTNYAKCFFINFMIAVTKVQMYFTGLASQLSKLRTSKQFKDNIIIL